MVYETGLLVGGISIVTACVSKFKFYVKKNGREYNITIQYIVEKPFIWGAYIKKY